MSVITVRNLSVAYRKQKVLQNIHFDVEGGTLTSIIGPNGAGKSTLIKAMLGLTPRLTGDVTFFDQPYSKVKKQIGYVPQRGTVDWDFPTHALDVVMMGLYGNIGYFKWPNRQAKQLAMDALAKMGMADYCDRQISQLSGGQQQRVFLARALVQDANIYFLDEPLAGVDAATERIIMETLQTLKNNGKTVMVVHHDLQTVEDYFDHVMLLNREVIAHGDTASTFTGTHLASTYGGNMRWIGEKIK